MCLCGGGHTTTVVFDVLSRLMRCPGPFAQNFPYKEWKVSGQEGPLSVVCLSFPEAVCVTSHCDADQVPMENSLCPCVPLCAVVRVARLVGFLPNWAVQDDFLLMKMVLGGYSVDWLVEL